MIKAISGAGPPIQREAPIEKFELARAAFARLPDRRRRRLRYMFGHMPYGAHEFAGNDWSYFTMLRDPVERCLSLYAHRSRHDGIGVDIERYYEEGRDHDQFNAQTLMVSGVPFEEPLPPRGSEEMLARAKENLEKFVVVGITERFDESIDLLQQRIGLRTVAYERRNVAPERPLRDHLPQGLIDRIVEWNSLDIELYATAAQLLEEQLVRQLEHR
jgi:hypothetical protein